MIDTGLLVAKAMYDLELYCRIDRDTELSFLLIEEAHRDSETLSVRQKFNLQVLQEGDTVKSVS